MAVTTQNSTEYAALLAGSTQETTAYGGRLRFMSITFAQSGAGDANSLVMLGKLPPGRIKLVGPLSFLRVGALGAGRTLDVGWSAYTDVSGSAVSADEDGLDDGIDVSAAATMNLGSATATTSGDCYEFTSRDGVVLQATVKGGTIPDTTALEGFVAYVAD
ncbi:MAG: hypothetical protein HQL50_14180 [Magnetococcales bacterium]|nr:hypothetical protein [Magnetococcales bacterium]